MKKIIVAVMMAVAALSAAGQNVSGENADTTQTQRKGYSRIDIAAGGGLQSLQYNPANGDQTPGAGWSAEVGYKYFFKNGVGIGAGIGVAYYTAQSKYTKMDAMAMYDSENSMDYEMRTYYNGVKEKQGMYQIEVPIGAYYKTADKKGWAFQCGGGLKFGFPVYGKYEYTSGNIETTAYYDETGVEYKNLPQHGLLSKDADGDADVDFSTLNVGLFVDLGATYKLTDMLGLYMGGYANFGFIDIGGDKEKGVYRGVLGTDGRGSVNTLSAGVKIGLNINVE